MTEAVKEYRATKSILKLAFLDAEVAAATQFGAGVTSREGRKSAGAGALPLTPSRHDTDKAEARDHKRPTSRLGNAIDQTLGQAGHLKCVVVGIHFVNSNFGKIGAGLQDCEIDNGRAPANAAAVVALYKLVRRRIKQSHYRKNGRIQIRYAINPIGLDRDDICCSSVKTEIVDVRKKV